MRFMRCWIECDICREMGLHTVSEEATSERQRVRFTYDVGWRRVGHKKSVVDACPECVARKQEEYRAEVAARTKQSP